MRRAIGPIIVIAVALGALGGFALGTGCSREAKPVVQPDDSPPPLPPASGSPIGFLVDDARLRLSDDQLAKLKDIDRDLAEKLSDLDGIERNTVPDNRPPSEPERTNVGLQTSSDRNPAGNGVSAGDSEPRRLSSGSNTMSAALARERRRVDPEGAPIAGPTPPPGHDDEVAATHKKVPEVRAYDIRTAVARALKLLDREQQKIARQVLVERGVDPDTGQFEATGQPGVVAPQAGSGSAPRAPGRRDR